MEDFKFIIYLVAALLYYLFTKFLKAGKQARDREQEELEHEKPRRARKTAEKPAQPFNPPTSFEDILKQLQPKAEQQAKEQTPGQERRMRDMPRQKDVFIPAREVRRAERQAQALPTEQLNVRALSLENPAEAREAALRSEQLRVVAPVPQQPARQKTRHPDFAALLRNPQNARQAVILSEILTRRYQ